MRTCEVPTARRLGAASIALVAMTGCASLLGIEEAQCDEELFPACAGKQTQPLKDSGGAPQTDDETDDSRPPLDAAAGAEAGIDGSPEAGAMPSATTTTPNPMPTAPDDGGPAPDPTVRKDASPSPPDGSAQQESGAPPVEEAGVTQQELCTEYCERMDNCADNSDPERPLLPQYSTAAQCMDVCTQVLHPQSEVPAGSRNSIECRLDNARAAFDAFDAEREANCQAASMYGGDFCGTACEVYCDMRSIACKAFLPDSGADDCLTECEQLDRSAEPFTINGTAGNTVECRINHIRLAIDTQLPALHCPHVLGAAPCQ